MGTERACGIAKSPWGRRRRTVATMKTEVKNLWEEEQGQIQDESGWKSRNAGG